MEEKVRCSIGSFSIRGSAPTSAFVSPTPEFCFQWRPVKCLWKAYKQSIKQIATNTCLLLAPATWRDTVFEDGGPIKLVELYAQTEVGRMRLECVKLSKDGMGELSKGKGTF